MNDHCVSTKWLHDNSLSVFVLGNGGNSHVFCIDENLPCGTAGHMLRLCEREACRLVTYAEVCSARSDCVETIMPVSQLSHTFDWSIIRSGKLILTSLSANPTTNRTSLSLSRSIAEIGDFLNKNNLGFVTNALCRIHHIPRTIVRFAKIDINTPE